MRTDYFLGGMVAFVVLTLAAEWASRKVWPADYPSQRAS